MFTCYWSGRALTTWHAIPPMDLNYPPGLYGGTPSHPPYFPINDVHRSKLEPEVQLHYESGESGESIDDVTNNNHPPADSVNYIQQTGVGRHPPLNRTDINIAIDETYCVLENGQQKWKCNLCPKYYTTKHNLVTHVLGHVGVRPYTCNLCNKAFKQIGHLNAHKQTHEGSKSHQCPICKRSFLRLIYVKRHMITHANRKLYTCSLCSEGFALPSELEAHMERHKAIGEYGLEPNNGGISAINGGDPLTEDEDKKQSELHCGMCGRVFLYPSQLKDHMLSHAQVRQHACSLCGMRFIKEHHLRAHQLTHTEERPHKCPICGRGFSLKGNMIRHTLIHQSERNFSCEVCGKKFSQPQTLKMHMVVHAEQKPYTCEICGKALARAHNLRSHMALHRNAKPFQCNFCGSAFTMKGNLQRHIKEKHKDILLTEKLNPDLMIFQPNSQTPPTQNEHADDNAHLMNGEASRSSFDESGDYGDGSEILDNDSLSPGGSQPLRKRRKATPKKLHRSPKNKHDTSYSNEEDEEDSYDVSFDADSNDSNPEEETEKSTSTSVPHQNESSPSDSKYFSHSNSIGEPQPPPPPPHPSVDTPSSDSKYFQQASISEPPPPSSTQPSQNADPKFINHVTVSQELSSMESKYFNHTSSLSQETGNLDLLYRIRALHAAIDDLAGRCGQSPEKVTAIHTAIDEMAGRIVYTSSQCTFPQNMP